MPTIDSTLFPSPTSFFSTMQTLTEQYLCKLTGAYDLELVKRLDLSNKQLKSLQGVELCPNLTELNISNNLIHDIEAVAALTQLERLDLSHNQINRLIVGLGTLTELTHLHLEHNAISSMDELRVLANLPKLKNLYLQNKKGSDKENSTSGGSGGGGGSSSLTERSSKNSKKTSSPSDATNPVCAHPAYTTTLLRYAPDLSVLDGERIQLRESTQQAMLDAMATPAAKLELPERQRWLEGYSWDTSEVQGTKPVRKKKARPGQQSKEEKPVPWTSMFSEEFVDAATNDQTIQFELHVSESEELDQEAQKLLQGCE